MKRKKRLYIPILFVLLLASLNANALEQECTEIPEQVEAAIKGHTQEIRGSEYCRFRRITSGDLDTNGFDDLVIVYSVEGACYDEMQQVPGSCGNKHISFIAVFLNKRGDYERVPPLHVGGRAERAIVGIRVSEDKIELDTLDYATTDPLCCPSVKGTLSIALKDRHLSMELDGL